MRLEELYLDGFGHFHQRIFSFSPEGKPVTVFYGPNEAGKSTLLAFIRTVLFGFPTQRRNEHYPPLSGDRHGGRIRLSGDDGEIYTLERYVGARGGSLTVRDGADDPVDPTDFMPCITGQATQAMFTNVFASVSTNSSRWGCWTTPRLARLSTAQDRECPGCPPSASAWRLGGGIFSFPPAELRRSSNWLPRSGGLMSNCRWLIETPTNIRA